jgi:hypothetical protein
MLAIVANFVSIFIYENSFNFSIYDLHFYRLFGKRPGFPTSFDLVYYWFRGLGVVCAVLFHAGKKEGVT